MRLNSMMNAHLFRGWGLVRTFVMPAMAGYTTLRCPVYLDWCIVDPIGCWWWGALIVYGCCQFLTAILYGYLSGDDFASPGNWGAMRKKQVSSSTSLRLQSRLLIVVAVSSLMVVLMRTCGMEY